MAEQKRRGNPNWVKGVSGNPKGRAPMTGEIAEVMELAYQHAPSAFRRMLELMKSTDERVALAAAEKVLDRACGKPAQAIEHSGEVAHRYVAEIPPVLTDGKEWERRYGSKTILQ